MRMSWRTYVMILLVGIWPGLGCVQTPGNKAVQDLRPMQTGPNSAKKPDLSAGDILANFGEKKRNEDIAKYEKMREAGGPQAVAATRKLAMLYEAAGDFDRAEDECKRLWQLNPKDADVLAKIGDLYAHRKQWDAAQKWYGDALFTQANHVAARTGLGFALARKGEYEKSFEQFCRVLSSKAEAYCEVAFVMQLDGKHQQAMQTYQQALNLDPTLARARTELTKLQQTITTTRVTNAGFAPAAVGNGVPINATRLPDGSIIPVGSSRLDVNQQVRSAIVEMETPPALVVEGTSRMRMQSPSLPPLPVP